MMLACYGPFWLVLVFVTTAIPNFADSTSFGSISGTVIDPSGAVIPGAFVQALHLETAATVTTTTNDQGIFWLPAVPVGKYKLFVQKAGFATWVQENLV